jgi:hypothetical protein
MSWLGECALAALLVSFAAGSTAVTRPLAVALIVLGVGAPLLCWRVSARPLVAGAARALLVLAVSAAFASEVAAVARALLEGADTSRARSAAIGLAWLLLLVAALFLRSASPPRKDFAVAAGLGLACFAAIPATLLPFGVDLAPNALLRPLVAALLLVTTTGALWRILSGPRSALRVAALGAACVVVGALVIGSAGGKNTPPLDPPVRRGFVVR